MNVQTTEINAQNSQPTADQDHAQLEQALHAAGQLPQEQKLNITPAAVEHLTQMFAQKPEALGLRLGIKKSGCSGFAYDMDYCLSVDAQDYGFERDGVRVFVHQDHLPAVAGAELDFVVEGLTRMLHVNNPNVEDSCGCGESFTLRD